ncbi:hypothetical protein [Lentilactobacillus fungorum]|nr:hypothetical protein [Lentilactobacillus fungorum]
MAHTLKYLFILVALVLCWFFMGSLKWLGIVALALYTVWSVDHDESDSD